MPRPSHRILLTPKYALSTSSISTREYPGFRTCVTTSNKHSSVVKRVPEPLTSILPPPNMNCRPSIRGTNVSQLRSRETADDTCESWLQSSYRSEEHTSELQSPCNLVCR